MFSEPKIVDAQNDSCSFNTFIFLWKGSTIILTHILPPCDIHSSVISVHAWWNCPTKFFKGQIHMPLMDGLFIKKVSLKNLFGFHLNSIKLVEVLVHIDNYNLANFKLPKSWRLLETTFLLPSFSLLPIFQFNAKVLLLIFSNLIKRSY